MNTTEWLIQAIREESFRSHLLSRITKSSSLNEQGCWIWKFRKDSDGYGVMKVTRSRISTAHRVSFVLHGGEFTPYRQCVLHSCHNTACCNPAHLRAGNQQENENDKVQAGRQCKGSKIHCSKLNEEKVRRIRAQIASNHYLTSIAKDHGVSRATVSKIKHKLIWTHLV